MVERFTQKKSELILPRGYSVTELRAMNAEDLQKACEQDGLDLTRVQELLDLATVAEPKVDDFELTPINPNQDFFDRVITVYSDEDYQINANDLQAIQRDRAKGELSESKAFSLLNKYEQDLRLNTAQMLEIKREIRRLFNEFVLQEALFHLDTYVAEGSSYSTAVHKVYVNYFQSGNRNVNVPILSDIYERLSRKFYLSRAGNAAEQRAATNKFVALLQKQQNGETTEKENGQITNMVQAVKGIYQRGSSTLSVDPEFEAALKEMSDFYRKTRPKNTMSAASVQGSEIYEAGAYADNSYSRGHRPRRYGDGLGSN